MPIELIILLLFIFWPLISRLFGQKPPPVEGHPPHEADDYVLPRGERPPQPQQRQRPPQRQRAEQQGPVPSKPHWETEETVRAEPDVDPLSEALRQIREALGQPEPEASRPPPAARTPEPDVTQSVPERWSTAARPERPQPVKQSTEARPEPSRVRVPAPTARVYDRSTDAPRQVEKKIQVVTGRKRHPLVDLRTHDAVKQAFILKEVLDAPPSRRFAVRRGR